MKIKEIVRQIRELKRRFDIVEKDATPEKEREWYTWAIANGHCEFVEQDNKILGFLEWVRLDYIPSSKCDIHINHDIIKTGPVAFAGNAIAVEPRILNMLKNRAAEKNKDATIFCWHNKKRDKIVTFKRRDL